MTERVGFHPLSQARTSETAVDESVDTQPDRKPADDNSFALMDASEAESLDNQLPMELSKSSSFLDGFNALLKQNSTALSSIYLFGVAMMLTRLGCGFYQTWRWKSQMIPVTDHDLLQLIATQCKKIGLRTVPIVGMCDRVLVPMVLGVFRPVILLPASFATGLSHNQMAAILCHELTHIRRLDPVFNLLQRIVESLLFFHPITWWISRQVRIERENCCDDSVSSKVGTANYAGALLQMAEQSLAGLRDRRCATANALAADGQSHSGLACRIRRLFGEPETLSLGWSQSLITDLITSFSIVAAVAISKAATQEADEWIRGKGEDVAFRIHGEVLNPDGSPAKDFELNLVGRKPQGEETVIDPKVEGNRFSVWVPAKQVSWALTLRCKSIEDNLIANTSINSALLRKTAIEGLKVHFVPCDLTAGSRQVRVRVVHRGMPVQNAWVTTQTFESNATERTGDDGVATFRLIGSENPSSFTAWTDDHRIGGFQFGRGPTRDAKLDFYDVEIFDCRPLKIRLVREDNEEPVANACFRMNVATPEPHFNFIGQNDDFTMVSDSKGEAIFPYWPDWPIHYSYLEIVDEQWVYAERTGSFPVTNDVMTVKLRRSAFDKRKLAKGRLNLPERTLGGFCVELNSFNAEEEGRVDKLFSFADKEGNYAARILPGATYSVFLKDHQWVSDFQTNKPFWTEADEALLPELTVQEGALLEIHLTAGPSRKPIRNQTVSVFSNFSFQFEEDGKSQNGTTFRQVFASSDESGIARIAVPEGQVRVSCTIDGWQGETSGTVESGKPLKLAIHRETEGKVATRIRLIAPEGVDADLSNCDVIIRSLDKLGRERLDLKSDANGECIFDSDSNRVAVGIRSPDGKLSIAMPASIGSEPIEIQLGPSRNVSGKLLDSDQKPLSGVVVSATANLREPNGQFSFGSLFNFTCKTGDDGSFAFEEIPENCQLTLSFTNPPISSQEVYIQAMYVYPGEDRNLGSIVIGIGSTTNQSISDRFVTTLRRARLGGFNTMVIGFNQPDDLKEFVKTNLMDWDRNADCGQYMQFSIVLKDNDDQDEEFLASNQWPKPERGEILVVALDQQGNELEKMAVKAADADAVQRLDELMKRNLPPQQDALKNWEAAFAEATRTNRKVWVRASQRFCNPCHLLSVWLDEHRQLLEQDYVMLKVDDLRDTRGSEIFKKICDDELVGIPFFAIYNTDGTKVFDSNGPLGNIGFPSSYEGRRHLKTMLLQTRKSITEQQIDQLVESLNMK